MQVQQDGVVLTVVQSRYYLNDGSQPHLRRTMTLMATTMGEEGETPPAYLVAYQGMEGKSK